MWPKSDTEETKAPSEAEDALVAEAEAKLKAEADAKEIADNALADEQAKLDAESQSTEGLVKMLKGNDELFVHPDTVEAHRTAGWKLA
jgi:regulator of protease activity HflC (stomatin/prohibitin superfamily)